MKRFTTLEEPLEEHLPRGIFGAIQGALKKEQELAHPAPYNPEDGSVWLLQSSDTDETLTETFGVPFTQLGFEQVLHYRDQELFVGYRVINNSRCDTLVIPDASWLTDEWREWLLAHLSPHQKQHRSKALSTEESTND